MTNAINPFHTLYLTEGVGDVDIPAVFSPVLVPHVAPLFLPGNVVLRGMQGTGKTMLLSLLETKVRLAFWAQGDGTDRSDPLQPAQRRFVGAGINLSKSNAFKFNEIRVSQDRHENIRLSRAYFGDYLNCWILRDLFDSVETLMTELNHQQDRKRLAEIGLTHDAKRLKKAIQILSADPGCSFLKGHSSVAEVRRTLTERLHAYRSLIGNPRNHLPMEIDETRSLFGLPLAAATLALRSAKVLEVDTNVIVSIDQFEQLIRKAPDDNDEQKHRRFIDLIDELISTRIREVSYRIGTRPNAQLKLSDAARDYVEVDLDSILQTKEHGRKRHGVFHRFAEDAFRRRIAVSQISSSQEIASAPSPIQMCFDVSPEVAERGRLCAPKKAEKVLRFDEAWSRQLRNFLTELAQQDVVTAKLAEAWIRQQLANNEPIPVANWRKSKAYPWASTAKRWWKKERLPLASLQIAAANAQRLLYYGEGDIVQLSGENILAFICICREIWECDARHRASSAAAPRKSFEPFAKERQAEGIRDASRIWHGKMEQAPNGNTLLRFLDVIGKKLHQQLIEDRQMSYPGANGISFSRQDLATDADVWRLLNDATAECYLLQRDHTPKNLSRGKSIKWYPHPILAPYYELTVPHTKEPLYLSVAKFRGWLEDGKVLAPKDKPEASKPKSRSRSKLNSPRGETQTQKMMFGGDE